MKKLPLLFIFLIWSGILTAQFSYSPVVDSLMDEMTVDTLTNRLEELSGEVPVMIGGTTHILETRYSGTTTNELAAQWIEEKLTALGISTEYQYFGATGENVIGTITGSLYPDQQFIISAHYDDMPSINPAPGADDNGSGVITMLESARLLSEQDLKYTVKFIAFDEEEQGLLGSEAYANEAASNGDDILGVLNLDMLAYDSDGDQMMSIATLSPTSLLTKTYTDMIELYEFDLQYNYISTTASDHSSFWNQGYEAINISEDWYDLNPNYHWIEDRVDNCVIPYYQKVAQCAFASLASLSMEIYMELIHEPILSSPSTDDRIAILKVNSIHPTGSGSREPRLYYALDGISFTEVTPYQNVFNLYYFKIPGQAIGTTVYYYVAAQDEASIVLETLPKGGRGIGPPGNIPPPELYSYSVDYIHVQTLCSNTLPKPILDLQTLYDTITVSDSGQLLEMTVNVDLNHTYDGHVEIYLISPDGTEVALSLSHGENGNDYTGTIFDDMADIPISEGEPPFTGSFIPDQPLSTFLDKEVRGDWILKIYDNTQYEQGKLNNWCINISHSLPVNVKEYPALDVTLNQNFPNPFSEHTIFPFEIENATHVRITVYDMIGREIQTIANQYFSAGKHQVRWQPAGVPSGNYLYKLQTDDFIDVKKLMILR